jgi:hypothetical protein
VYFLKALPPALAESQLAELDNALGLSSSRNAEIARAWFTEVARRRHLPAYPAMREFMERTGRIRLIEPVYRGLVENGQDAALARAIFERAGNSYHPLTVEALRPLLGADNL